MIVEFGEVASVAAACRAAMDVHGWARNECVIAGRGTFEMCRRVGWRARPLTVAAYVTHPDTKVACGTDGSGSLRFIPTPTSHVDGMFDTEWDGHLLILVERRWIVDVTADQFSRPDHGIVLSQPVVFDIPDGQRVTVGASFGGADEATGLTMMYQVVDDTMVWQQQYWWDSDYWLPVVDTGMNMLDIDNRQDE